MKAINYLSILSLGILFGCTNKNFQDTPYIHNQQLSSSYKSFDNSFKKTRSKLSFSSGQTATNCETYFDLYSKHNIDENIHNQLVKSEYLLCDALKILSYSSGVSRKGVSVSHMGEELLSKLDLRSFPSSLRRAGSEESHTLKALYPQHTSFTDTVAKLDAEDWTFTLEVVAVASINGNSIPDWIIWVLDESKSGNYRGYSTLIIYDPVQQHDKFKATTYP